MLAALLTHLVNSLIMISDGLGAKMISWYTTVHIFIRSSGNTSLMESIFLVIEVSLFIVFALVWHG